MGLFSKNKLKVKTENNDNKVKFYIEYFKLKNQDGFKKKLFEKLFSSSLCLAIINTKLLIKNQVVDYSADLNKLLEEFERLDIKYKKIIIKKPQNINVFGIPVMRGDNKKYEEYIIGFIAKPDKLEAIQSKLHNYNLQYFIDFNGSIDELFGKFEQSFDEEEELSLNFKYYMIDNNFMEQMVIYSAKDDSLYISEILESVSKDSNIF